MKWAVVFLCLLTPAFAHDHEHPELNEWMKTLQGKGPCCDGSDAKHLTDVEWRTKDGHYQVYINQYSDDKGAFLWVDVPDDAVVKGPNLDGRTLVWPIWGLIPTIRCFMPGPEG